MRKYSDSYEHTRDQLRAAIYAKFNSTNPDLDIIATYPDENVAVVHNWSNREYYEISYTIAEDTVTLGDLKQTEHEELFITTEQINNSMKWKQPLILINSVDKPTYRVLVQTDEELPAYDMNLDHIKYNSEGIKKAMPSLLGKEVWDDSNSNHAQVRGDTTKNRFAKVVNEGYCPEYGGYVDLEVHDLNYVSLMNSMIDSLNRGLPVDLGFSTELNGDYTAKEYGENSLEVLDWSYGGLVLTDAPRDERARVCDVINNSILKNNKGDDILTEIVKINKTEYDELKQAKNDLDELQGKYKEGEKLYKQNKEKYDELQKEEADLRKQLVPIWTQQGEQKEAMVNSLLKTVPEAERKEKKKLFESMNIDQLGVIVNSLPTNSSSKGVRDGGSSSNSDSYSESEFEKDYEAAYGEKP